MIKRIVSLLLVVLLLFSITVCSYAHDDQKEHDADLKAALFGSRDKILTGERRTAFQAIADAAAISIDQFSPNTSLQWKKGVYEELQQELKELGVPTLKVKFSDLDLNANVANGKNITANSHRRFTHLGWNYKNYPNMEFWNLRRQVLIDVVYNVLFKSDSLISNIPWVSNLLMGPDEKCEAFAGMVYYIHILGDHIEGDDPEKLTDLEPLIHYVGFSSPGIIPELQEQIQVVLSDQRTTRIYMSLMQDLSDLQMRAEKNCGTWGSVDTFEKCTINQKYAEELLDILSQYLPILLERESVFQGTVFQMAA